MRRVLEEPVREGILNEERSEVDEGDIGGLEMPSRFVNGLDTIVDLEVSGLSAWTISGIDLSSSRI